MANRIFLYFTFFSLGIHLVLFYSLKTSEINAPYISENESQGPKAPPIKIRSAKNIGLAHSTSNIQIPKNAPTSDKSQGTKSKLHLSDLSLFSENQTKRFHNKLRPKETIKAVAKTQNSNQKSAQKILKIEAEEMKEIFGQRYSGDVLSQNFDNNDVDIKFVVPKGVSQDELNKFEMQFYAFRMRTAVKYMTTFYKELYDFERKNPHLKFPMTKKNEQLTGMITYDKDGNIIRIKMVQWTDEKRLQDFFLDMLKKLNTLPNPPKEMVQDGEFTVYYGLNINL